jgi:hypothetical protein
MLIDTMLSVSDINIFSCGATWGRLSRKLLIVMFGKVSLGCQTLHFLRSLTTKGGIQNAYYMIEGLSLNVILVKNSVIEEFKWKEISMNSY